MIPIEDEKTGLRWLFAPEWHLGLLSTYPASDLEAWRVTDAAKGPQSPQGRYLIEPATEDSPRQGALI